MKKQYNLALTQYSQEKDKASLKSFNTLAKMAKKYKYYNYNEQIKTYSARLKQRLANKAYDEGKEFEENNNLEQAFAKYTEAVNYVKDHKAKNEMKRLNSVIAQDLYDQGLQAFSSGKKAKAIELLEKSLKYDPDKTEAKRALERIK
jgi:tetratricopeptide (TPR) repeat protein